MSADRNLQIWTFFYTPKVGFMNLHDKQVVTLDRDWASDRLSASPALLPNRKLFFLDRGKGGNGFRIFLLNTYNLFSLSTFSSSFPVSFLFCFFWLLSCPGFRRKLKSEHKYAEEKKNKKRKKKMMGQIKAYLYLYVVWKIPINHFLTIMPDWFPTHILLW